MEPWMKPILWSFAPLLLVFVLPHRFRIPLVAIGVALFLIAVVMLLRQQRATRRDSR